MSKSTTIKDIVNYSGKIWLTGALVIFFIVVPGLIPILRLVGSSIGNLIMAYSYRIAVVFMGVFLLLNYSRLKFHWTILLFILLISGMTLTGFTSGPNNVQSIFQPDLFVHLGFLFIMIMGYNRLAYYRFVEVVILSLMVGIGLNLIGLAIQPTFLSRAASINSLAYSLQVMLTPSFLLLFQLKTLDKRERNIVLIAFALYGIEQILFQKRAPLIRFGFTLFLLSLSLSFLQSYGRKAESVFANTLRYGFIIVMIGSTALVLGLQIDRYVEATYSRFTKQGNVSSTFENDARLKIGEYFIDDLKKTGDMTLGRGFGGVVYGATFQQQNNLGQSFRANSEMGVPTILLKGGIPLLVYWIIIAFLVLLKFGKARRSQIAFSFWITTFIFFSFLYVEGYIGAEQNVFHLMVAYSNGYLFSIRTKSVGINT